MSTAVQTDSPSTVRNRRSGEKRRQKTRETMLEAAIEVIAKRGYDAPGIDDFIAAAGMARGTFYNHFKTKEALVGAIVRHIHTQLEIVHEAVLSLIADPAERLVWNVRNIVLNAETNPRVMLLLLTESPRLAVLDDLIRIGPKFDIGECIRLRRLPYQDIEVAVDMVVGVTREAARAAVSTPRPPDHAAQVATLLLRGLGMSCDESRRLAYGEHLPLPDSIG